MVSGSDSHFIVLYVSSIIPSLPLDVYVFNVFIARSIPRRAVLR